MKYGIIESSQLPEGDKVYLKKDRWGWRTVQPIEDENGKKILVNLVFGGMRNLITLIIMLLVLAFVFAMYYHDVTQVQKNCQSNSEFRINPSNLNITIYGGDFPTNGSPHTIPLSSP